MLKKHISKENIILFSACVLLPLYMRFGTPAAFDIYLAHLFTDETVQSFARAAYHYITIFFLLGLVPFLIIKSGFKEPLSAYGMQKGDQAFGFRTVFILLIPISLVMMITAAIPGKTPPLFSDIYPAIPAVKGSMGLFVASSILLFIYYFTFEFFYRGFLLFGLKEKFGSAPAILIQAIPSIIIHFDKPNGELFSSILAEILLGMLALRTGSIFYGILLHFFVGVSIELAMVIF